MARKPSERRHGQEEEAGEVDLTPIMSILVILIPMLIFAFSFFEVKIQEVSAPKMSPTKEQKKEPDKKPLNLTVLVTEKGFSIKQEEDLTVEPDQPIPKRVFQIADPADPSGKRMKEVHEYDYPTLYSRLMKKKKLHKEEQVINIGADHHIPWHIIARTIDASRVQLEESAYTDLTQWSQAKPKKDGAYLFPQVVFTVAE